MRSSTRRPMVGVAQSMYEVAEYTSVNNQGTANLLQALIENRSSV